MYVLYEINKSFSRKVLGYEKDSKTSRRKMQKSIHVLSNEFAAVRAGRANPAILDRVMVDYYGAPTAINQLAAVSVSEARVLVIQPWDVSSLKALKSNSNCRFGVLIHKTMVK